MTSKKFLSELNEGENCKMIEIADADESLRKRMMHLGFLAGQKIEVVLKNSSNNSPLTVRVRGTLIALRREEADSIQIERESHE